MGAMTPLNNGDLSPSCLGTHQNRVAVERGILALVQGKMRSRQTLRRDHRWRYCARYWRYCEGAASQIRIVYPQMSENAVTSISASQTAVSSIALLAFVK
jgi:hypothetical protein